jgi:hypothetical protein
MGKIDEFAANCDLTDLENAFGALSDRARAVKERGAEVKQRWADYFDEKDKSIAAAENAINKLSNLPASTEQKKALPQSPTTNVDAVRPRLPDTSL